MSNACISEFFYNISIWRSLTARKYFTFSIYGSIGLQKYKLKGMVQMKLSNGYGSVVKLSGKRRKPYQVRKTVGWHFDKKKDKQVQGFIIIGYVPNRAEGLQMLADYNRNPFDTKAAKMTFDDVYA